MNASRGIAPQLRHLLDGLAKQGDTHLNEVGTDLQQTAFLLAEAIEKLGKSFIGMHDTMGAQQALIDSLQEGAGPNAAQRSNLAQLRAESQAHVDAAVTALQFQDMTGQLIGRVVGHVQNLHEVLQAAGASAAGLAADDSDGAARAVLAEVNRMLDEKSAPLDHVARKAVAQTHMESGDIELF